MLTDLYQQKKAIPCGGFVKNLELGTAATTQDVLAPKVSTLTIWVQRIRVHVLTGNAGKTWQFRAKTTTTTIFTTTLDMSTAGVTHLIDLGSKGKALPLGETLEVVISAAGAAGHIEVEGYYR